MNWHWRLNSSPGGKMADVNKGSCRQVLLERNQAIRLLATWFTHQKCKEYQSYQKTGLGNKKEETRMPLWSFKSAGAEKLLTLG